MHHTCEQPIDQVPTLQEQSRQLQRSIARIDGQIVKEQERLRRIETRLAALARQEALAA